MSRVKSHVGQVEVLIEKGREDPELERVFFPIPEVCKYVVFQSHFHLQVSNKEDQRGLPTTCIT